MGNTELLSVKLSFIEGQQYNMEGKIVNVFEIKKFKKSQLLCFPL